MGLQLRHQRIAQGQVGLHGQRPCLRLGVERSCDEGFVDRRDEAPAHFAAGRQGVWIGALPSRYESLRQTPGMGALIPPSMFGTTPSYTPMVGTPGARRREKPG